MSIFSCNGLCPVKIFKKNPQNDLAGPSDTEMLLKWCCFSLSKTCMGIAVQ